MKVETLIFDLDGTISDPKEGIFKSINFALEHFSFEAIEEHQVDAFIGPPLDLTFSSLTQSTDQKLIHNLVARYRERYADIGYQENKLYDGIPSVLQQLHNHQHCRLGLCTSKRVDFAEQILTMFNLREHFDFLSGGDIGIHKWQQLHQLLADGITNKNSLMIGDRDVDLIAAHKNQLSSAGVLWGYGDLTELQKEDPAFIFEQPHQLIELAS
ncbi:MAG: HAD hydrolase-like protein [Thiotrichaceae bacterium]|nr:HAD hydrolase-like protein [Thiotrichaceae bacterium]